MIKINWEKLLEGINIDYLVKDSIEMNTSQCIHYVECLKIYKKLDDRLNKQLSKLKLIGSE